MCVRPMTAVFTKDTRGKWRPSFMRWNDNLIDSGFRDVDQRLKQELANNIVMHNRAVGSVSKAAVIPCGQCHECRLQRSRMWANRCIMEMSEYPSDDGICRNWFVTLTYAPEHTDELRSVVDCMTLSLHQPDGNKKDHLAMFNNAVRQKWQRRYNHEGVRFYACGEYGGQKCRPHYHEILFNLPIDPKDLTFLFANKFGDRYYNCDLLSEAWGDKGFVVISEANWSNAAYVARYIMKKQTGELGVEAYDKLGILPPFTRMSRMPGIGGAYYKGFDDFFKIDENTGELLLHDTCYIPSDGKHDAAVRPPAYFSKLFEKDNPEAYEMLRKMREDRALRLEDTNRKLVQMSDRDLFDLREQSWNKQKLGFYRDFVDSHM